MKGGGNDQLQRDTSGGLMRQQLVNDSSRMTKPRGLDQNSIGSRCRHKLIEVASEIGFASTTQTTTGDEPHVEGPGRSRRYRQRIDARIGEFIE